MAGRAVNVEAWRLRRIADFPADWHHVRIDVDGTISPADYERVGRP